MKILVIDDELVSLAKLKAIFDQYGQCDAVSDGNAALKKFAAAVTRGDLYALVTIDIEMPTLSGLDILERLNRIEKENGAAPAVKLMVSGSSTRDNVLKASKLRCDGFLVKPVTPALVGQKLQSLGIKPSEQPT